MEIDDIVKIGYGEVDITPDKPVELVGFFRPDNQSRGILHRLILQVMVLKMGSEINCLMTIDSLGFTVELANRIRDRIAEALHTKRQNVMVCFSHTHAAPNAATVPGYFEFVCKQALVAVKRAKVNLSPVYVGWGIGESDIGINRRDELEYLDKRLGILKFIGPKTKDIQLMLLRVTAHANVLCSDNYLLSSDYFGVTRELLEQHYGCKIMIIQGAAGDIRPKHQQDNAEYLEIHAFEAALQDYSQQDKEKYLKQSEEALDNMAKSILQTVEEVAEKIDTKPISRLKMCASRCRLTADVPEIAQALTIAEEAKIEAGIDGTAWLGEVEGLQYDGIKAQHSEVEIQYFFINEGCICGVANEVMCKVGLDVEQEAGVPFLFFNGYTNGCSSYLPTAEEYDKGGYEVLWSNLIYFPYHKRVMPFNRNTADKLIKEVVGYWKQVVAPEKVLRQ